VFSKALKYIAAGCCSIALTASVHARQADQGDMPVASLPAEAQVTLNLIKQGGPFPYAKDGVVFGNYERKLPQQRRGYYHEYTVPTPGARTRGARRIIVGGTPSYRADYFYTGDHYASFQRIKQN
jgi:ribonuclease T1